MRTPSSAAAASAWRATTAQAAMELRLTARRGENVLVTIVIPAVLLVFFASTNVLPSMGGRAVDILPGILAIAVVSNGLVNLGVATGYERAYGVLKRLGGTPLSRAALIAAKMIAVAAVECVQVVLLVALAVVLFGWTPGPGANAGLAIGALILGTVTFAGLGLALAGSLRAEATLAIANGLFLVLLLLGGAILPIDHLPEPLRVVASILPGNSLAELLRAGLASGTAFDPPGGTGLAAATATLVVWAVGAITVAVRTFRWE